MWQGLFQSSIDGYNRQYPFDKHNHPRTIYVFKNFDTIRDFTFFCDFDGDNLIFVLWLILLVFPLFDSFEGFGISLNRRKQEEADKLNQEVVQKAKDASSPSEVMDIEQLKAYLKKMEGKSDEW